MISFVLSLTLAAVTPQEPKQLPPVPQLAIPRGEVPSEVSPIPKVKPKDL